MEKVKITQEQADAIEYVGAGCSNTFLIRKKLCDPGWFAGRHKSIRDMDNLIFIDALRIGYEVGLNFNAGDWIHVTSFDGVGVYQVITTDESLGAIEVDSGARFYITDDIRHATSEEIERATEFKLDNILLKLTSVERTRLKTKLNDGG